MFHAVPSWFLRSDVISGVGFSPNQTYRRDGYRNTDHELEDQSFHFRIDDNICLYGVFDGHCGPQAALFVKQRMPAEILLGQLDNDSTEEEVCEVLRKAFSSVEEEYFQYTIANKLAERATLLTELPEGKDIYEGVHEFPHLRAKFEELNHAVASGTTAVVVLIFHGRIYVSNVGDSRALLCCTEGDGVLSVRQLSVDHDLNSEEELRRLQCLNVNTSYVRRIGRLGNQSCTRCLGNYLVKGGYKEIEHLRSAISEPVIADPEIQKGVPVDESTRFLMLLSRGLYTAVAEATDGKQANTQLAQMVADEFQTQTSLTGVAQAVIDKVSRMHHEHFMADPSHNVNHRDDMTLLVRNFNFPLPNSATSPVNGKTPPFPNRIPSIDMSQSTPTIVLTGSPLSTLTNTVASSTTESSDFVKDSVQQIPLDENGRVRPYVDFSDYYKNVDTNFCSDNAS